MLKGRNKPKKDRKDTTPEALGLYSVPFFSQPMSAGPKDEMTGVRDESGAWEYVTPTGKKYFVKPDPDQRTTRTKVQEDVIPAISDYVKNPKLPSADQVKNALGEVVKGAAETFESTVKGDGTYGDAMGLAVGSGAASTAGKVPEGALRVGGGRNTDNPKYNPLFKENKSVEYEDTYRGVPIDWSKYSPQAKGLAKLFNDLDDTRFYDGNSSTKDLQDAANIFRTRGAEIGIDEEYLEQIAANVESGAYHVDQAVRKIETEAGPDINNEYTNIVYEEIKNDRLKKSGGTEFYNPLRNSVENMEFGKNGLKGETIAAFLEKRAPKVRKSLLRSADSGRGIFDPKKRYTQEETLSILDENFGSISAKNSNNPMYRGIQRMSFLDNKELDYGELLINQDRSVNFKPNYTHYDDNTLAHARYSVRDDGAGGEMLLVEELQSDLVQKGFSTDVKGTPTKTHTQAAEDLWDAERGNYPPFFIDLIELNDRNSNKQFDTSDLLDIADQIDEHKGIPDQTRDFLKEFDVGDMEDYLRRKIDTFVTEGDPQLEEFWGKTYEEAQKGVPPVSLPPIDSTTEFVRPLIHSLIKEAKNRGIDKVVIPNSEAFIEARKDQLGYSHEEVAAAKKAFKSTYDDAVDKVLREMDREKGVDITVEPINLKGKSRPSDTLSPDEFFGFEADAEEALAVDNITPEEFRGMSEEDYFEAVERANPNGLPPDAEEWISSEYERLRSTLVTPKNGGIKFPSRMINIGNIPEGKVRFAEGGLVENKGTNMDDQMEFAFNDGGMATSKASVDPVSGNEVPPGSSPKEVRDDVDAKISEGEYIFPADVVQFYGVDKLEKMITKAKESLGDMEARGRMGTQENEEGEEDDLPLSDEELETEGEMDDSEALAFAEGGVVGSFDPSQYAYTGGTETRMYVNAAGEKRPILFIDGNPASLIPPGFTPESKQAPAATPAGRPSADLSTPKTSVVNSGEQREQPAQKPVSEWGVEDFQSWDKGRQVSEKLIGGAGRVIGGMSPLGPLGAVLGGSVVKNFLETDTKNKLAEIEARLNDPSLDPTEAKMYSDILNNVKNKDKEEEAGPLSNLFGTDGFLSGIFGKEKAPTATQRPTAVQRPPTKAPAPTAAPTTSARPQARPDGLGSPSKGSARDRDVGDGTTRNSRGEERAEGGLIKNTVRYNNGGLVKKRC